MVIEELNKLRPEKDKSLIMESRNKLNNIIEALNNNSGLKASTGSWQGATAWIPNSKRDEFLGGIAQFVGQETLDKLIQSKSFGATFGALSDKENAMLAAAANKLGQWVVKRDDGTIKYFKVPESAFRRELENIRDGLLIKEYRLSGANEIPVIQLSSGKRGYIPLDEYDRLQYKLIIE
jgi:hypothetical protein